MEINGKFEVTLAPMEAYAQSKDCINLGRMSLEKVYFGELNATSQGEMLSARTTQKGSAGYVAIELVTGLLNAKQGSFALQHFGVMDKGQDRLILEVIPDSASGQLKGLSGTMTIKMEQGKHFYTFDYQL